MLAKTKVMLHCNLLASHYFPWMLGKSIHVDISQHTHTHTKKKAIKVSVTCTLDASQIQKNPRVRKIFVRNSGAGNGCANFMDTWKKCVRSAGKTVSIKFLVLGGGGILGFGGGGSADFIFMGARIFLTNRHHVSDTGMQAKQDPNTN